jgi:Domain of unknown function (DUF6894)
MFLIKIVASFSSNLAIVYFNCDDQTRFEFNVCVLNKRKSWHVLLMENLMPRFYFNVASKDAHIPDDTGKELATLNDAYEHARKLIHKILFHVGHDDAEAWKVVILNNEHDAQMIIPFSVSHAFSAQRRRKE